MRSESQDQLKVTGPAEGHRNPQNVPDLPLQQTSAFSHLFQHQVGAVSVSFPLLGTAGSELNLHIGGGGAKVPPAATLEFVSRMLQKPQTHNV